MLEIQKIAEEAIADMDIKKIISDAVQLQVKQTVDKAVVSNYGSFSSFERELTKKLSEEQASRMDTLNAPEFGRLSVDIVEQELLKIESTHKKELVERVHKRLTELIGVSQIKTIKDIVVPFIDAVYDEVTDTNNGCYCEDEEFIDSDSKYEELEGDLYFIFNENTWGTYGKWITPTLTIAYKEDFSIEMRLHRKSVGDAFSSNDGIENLYTITSIAVDGEDITDSDVVKGKKIAKSHLTASAELCYALFVNSGAIDISDLDGAGFEHTKTES